MSDDVVWDCIRHGHCSFIAKVETAIFYRNPYIAMGICNRSFCPFANSRYATIRDYDGIFYLCMKTPERSHLPKKLWERVKLPRNYEKAIEVVDKHLEFWPKLLVHKIKQRLTKMTQYRIRMKKLQLKVREKIVTVPRKKALREIRGEAKALKAAKIDNCIQREIFERLTNGCYKHHGIHNYEYEEFMKILALKGEPVPEIEDEEFSENEEEYVETDYMETKMDDIEDFEGILTSKHGDIHENDDLLLGLAEKKQKRSSSNSRSMVGKRSRKVITELEQDEDTDNRQKTLV